MMASSFSTSDGLARGSARASPCRSRRASPPSSARTVASARLARQQADLAERRARLEDRELAAGADVAVDRDGRPAGGDHEHGRAVVALADDRLALGEAHEARAAAPACARSAAESGREERARLDGGEDQVGRIAARQGPAHGVLVLADHGVRDRESLALEPVPDALAHARVDVEVARVVLEPVAQLVLDARSRGTGRGRRPAPEATRRPGRPRPRPRARRAPRAGGSVVLEADLQGPRDRDAAAPEDLEAVAAGDGCWGSGAALPSIVRTLIARHESCSTSPIVSPARIMSPTWTVRSRCEREAREEVAERVLEREAEDGRDDRRGRQQGGEADRELDLEQDARAAGRRRAG